MTTTAALVEGHYFTSYSNGASVPKAGCECGVSFEWEGRDDLHAAHVLEVVRAEGRAQAAAALRDEVSRVYALMLDADDPTARTLRLVHESHLRDALHLIENLG